MKLLFDQNISFRLVKQIQTHFKESTQFRIEGLENSSDREIWQFAKDHDFVIVTFDADFYDFSLVWGHPPKVIWIRSLDQSTDVILKLLIERKNSIGDFISNSDLVCLEIIRNVT